MYGGNVKVSKKRLFFYYLSTVVITCLFALFILASFVSFGFSLKKTAALLLFIFIDLFAQIAAHEAGHLLFGLMCGFKLVSFRVMSFIIINEGSGVKFRRYKAAGAGGQCLMEPAEHCEKRGASLYMLGGIIANFVFSAVFLPICFIFPPYSIFTALFVLHAYLGALLILQNGYPVELSGLSNDMQTCLDIDKDDLAYQSFLKQLKINAFLSKGCRLKDMPEELFHVSEKKSICPSYSAVLSFINLQRILDGAQFDETLNAINKLLSDPDGLTNTHKNELRCEALFIELITQNREDKINELLSNELRRYIKRTRNFLSKRRLLYAYELLHEKNKATAAKQFEKFKKLADNTPYTAEAESEKELISIINKNAFQPA